MKIKQLNLLVGLYLSVYYLLIQKADPYIDEKIFGILLMWFVIDITNITKK